jgi:hypothetical protein
MGMKDHYLDTDEECYDVKLRCLDRLASRFSLRGLSMVAMPDELSL